jgi:hypothetical protein
MNDSLRFGSTARRLSWLVIVFGIMAPGLSALANATDNADALAGKLSLPPSIVAEAQRRGIALQHVKQQGEYWIGCEGEQADAACIVLGRVNQSLTAAPLKLTKLTASSVLEVHRYGEAVQSLTVNAPSSEIGKFVRESDGVSFEMKPGVEARVSVQGRRDQVIDTLPRYRREGTNLVRTKDYQFVREYIDSHPGEPFAMIVTVPALCEPCRKLDKLVHENLAPSTSASTGSAVGLPMKVFVLEYFNFGDAEKELLGPGAVFPTTLVYGVEAEPRRSISRFIGNLRGNTLEELSRPLADKFRRGSPHTMSRGVVAKDLLFGGDAARLSRR